MRRLQDHDRLAGLLVLALLTGCQGGGAGMAAPDESGTPAAKAPADARPRPAVTEARRPDAPATPGASEEVLLDDPAEPVARPHTAVFEIDLPGGRLHTGDPPWDAYNEAQKRWQQSVQDLMVRRRPELQDVSQATLMMQWALLDLRAVRIRYLLAHDPDRFVRDQQLAQFIHFAWTPDDTAALRQADGDYVALEARVQVLRAAAESHEDYAASREFLKELLLDPEFRETVATFAEAGEAVERMLNAQSDGSAGPTVP